MVFTRDHIALINVDERSLLISAQNQLVIHVQWPWILNNLSEMLRSFIMVLRPIFVSADVGDLLIICLPVVLLSLVEVVLVLVIDVWVLVVLVLLSQLKDYLVLLRIVLIIWVNEHILVIIRHIKVLINLFFLLDDAQNDLLFLNQELRVLMLQKWRIFGMLFFICDLLVS